jgi:glutamyl-tRNA reductase
MRSLVLIGLSHRRAPVEVRERVALTDEQELELSAMLAGEDGEAVCLSTCNRTEIYRAVESASEAEPAAISALAEVSGIPVFELERTVYRLRDDDVALHLFRVASGLDSLVPGEGQILGQVRGAFERGATGPLLDRLFRDAIYTGRKVRSETAIGEVPASVAAAAAALAEQLFGDLGSCRVALLGAGTTADLAAQSLVARGARIELVGNRSPAKADEIAARVGGHAVPLHDVPRRLAEIDVLVASTSARAYVLRKEDVEPTMRARSGRPLFLIDIAVPRDLDPAVHDLEGCFLYDIDDLEAVVSDSAPDRAGQALQAEAIATAQAERFRAWRAARDVAPAIASMRARAEEIRAAELARARTRLNRLSDAELLAIDTVTARIVDKLLHGPTLRLKEAAAGADSAVRAALLDMFDLPDHARPGRNPRQ